MKNIAVIGVGNLGARHFQSILNCEEEVSVYLVDNLQVSLEKACSLIEETNTKKVTTLQNISDLPIELEVVVIATSSNVRAKIIKELVLNGHVIKYFVLEKVLFQSVNEYEEIGSLLKEKNIKTYVNCGRRMFTGYNQLKQKLENDPIKNVVVTGGSWGLGCNSIHMVDLIAYLCGDSKNLLIKSSLLDEEVIDSKRDGFIEFTGILVGNLNGVDFTVTCNKNTNEAVRIYIFTEKSVITIIEAENSINIISGDSLEKFEIGIKFQSQASGPLVDLLIKSGTCNLTEFDESCELHIPILNAFLEHLQRQGKGGDGVCKIT